LRSSPVLKAKALRSFIAACGSGYLYGSCRTKLTKSPLIGSSPHKAPMSGLNPLALVAFWQLDCTRR